MYFLDTDTITLAHAEHPAVSEHMRRIDENEIAITIVTMIEILQGRFAALLKAENGKALGRAQEFLQRSQQQLGVLEIVPVNAASAAVFDRLLQNKKLKKSGRADLLIASICLAHRATLVTRNRKDFQNIPGLRLENWAH